MNQTKIGIKIALSLLNGSHDFIKSAVIYANGNDNNSWKFSVLHLVSAFELLLKSRLADEHWSFVFADLDKATLEKLYNTDFISTDMGTSIKRLKNIANIEIPKKDKILIKNLGNIRNKLIHFNSELSENKVKAIMAQGLNAYIEFYNINITPNWETYSEFGYELSTSLIEFKEFLKSRLESLSIALKNSDRPKTNYFWECSECLQDTIIINQVNLLKCIFCGNQIEVADYAEFYSIEGNVENCPSCNYKSFIVTSVKNDDKNYECIICGHYIGKPQKFHHTDGYTLKHIRSFNK